MKNKIGYVLLSTVLLWAGCARIGTSGQPGAPVLTFSQATNAALQGLHAYAVSIAAAVNSGTLSMDTPTKAAFNNFAAVLNVADATYVAYIAGKATEAQVTSALTQAESAKAAITALSPTTGGN